MAADLYPRDSADLSALGELLEAARESLGLSKRQAAERAGISEVRWRQIVTRVPEGQQAPRPRRNNLIRMAQAVGVDPDRALNVAGFALLPKVPAMSPEEGWIQLEEVQKIVAGESHNLIAKLQDDESLTIEHRIELIRTVIELQTRLRRALRMSHQAGARWDSSA